MTTYVPPIGMKYFFGVDITDGFPTAVSGVSAGTKIATEVPLLPFNINTDVDSTVPVIGVTFKPPLPMPGVTSGGGGPGGQVTFGSPAASG
jgi:hypothetical protein